MRSSAHERCHCPRPDVPGAGTCVLHPLPRRSARGQPAHRYNVPRHVYESLLLEHAERTLGKAPAALTLADIDETLILGFLDELETRHGNAVRTRNARLAAIRSFLQFATRRDVANLATTTAALSVPMKRFERPMLGFLSREQMLAVLDLPATDWLATRDRVLLHLLYNAGARVSELVAICVDDVVTGDGACVHLLGKGRKRRTVPLSIRHTTAMHLLQSGVDISVIALWLGYESLATTQHYVEADLAMKERALARREAPEHPLSRYRPPDSLIGLLRAL